MTAAPLTTQTTTRAPRVELLRPNPRVSSTDSSHLNWKEQHSTISTPHHPRRKTHSEAGTSTTCQMDIYMYRMTAHHRYFEEEYTVYVYQTMRRRKSVVPISFVDGRDFPKCHSGAFHFTSAAWGMMSSTSPNLTAGCDTKCSVGNLNWQMLFR